jgi:hypothetical protein
MSSESRLRLALGLTVAAALAYLFYRLAFSWWWWRAIVGFHVRWRIFEDWRWWVGAFLTMFALLIAGFSVLAGDRKSRTLPKTPVDDPAHRLCVDEAGRESGPHSDTLEDSRSAPFSYVPQPGDAARANDAPAKRGRPATPWLWPALAATIVFVSFEWYGIGLGVWELVVSCAIAMLLIALWLLVRRSL